MNAVPCGFITPLSEKVLLHKPLPRKMVETLKK